VLSHAIEDREIQKVHDAQNQQYHTDFFADNLNGFTGGFYLLVSGSDSVT